MFARLHIAPLLLTLAPYSTKPAATIADHQIAHQSPADKLRTMDTRIEAAMKEFGIPGLALGVIVDGKPVYTRGFGVRDTESNQPVTPETLFPLGSCSEPFTSLLLGILADEERIDLDAPLTHYIPTFRMKDAALTSRVTTRDLLAQRTGLPEFTSTVDQLPAWRTKLVDHIETIPIETGFRTSFNSSPLNIAAAEHLIERITEQTWEDAVRNRVFKTLSMNHAGFGPRQLISNTNAARPHIANGSTLKPVDLKKVPTHGPIGWINAGVDDLLKWLAVYVNNGTHGGKRIVQEQTLRQMIQPHIFVYWGSSEPFSPTHYGLFWGVNSYRGHYHARLGGFGNGFDSLVSFLPGEKIGVVLLANRGDKTLPLLSAIKFEIVDLLLDLDKKDWIAWARQRMAR